MHHVTLNAIYSLSFPHCTLCTMNTTLATNVTYEDPPCCWHAFEHHRHQSTWQMFHLTSLPLHLAGAAASLPPWSTPTHNFLKENFEYNNRQYCALQFASEHYFNTTVSNIAKILCWVLWWLYKEQKRSNANVWILRDVVMWGMEKIPCRPVRAFNRQTRDVYKTCEHAVETIHKMKRA